ncbi:hypothetical protein [Amycolatopsis sp.]|jgi:hypothetical protein|uniref:hypothetical protein n=1 Tax=Amycolatopsis sp. TaxID=37632 RepID=UPI002629D2B8|nr:hypothetical protein [Amycolatopsis sp.]
MDQRRHSAASAVSRPPPWQAHRRPARPRAGRRHAHPAAPGHRGTPAASRLQPLGIDVRSAPEDFVRYIDVTYPSIYDPPGRSLQSLRGYPRKIGDIVKAALVLTHFELRLRAMVV